MDGFTETNYKENKIAHLRGLFMCRNVSLVDLVSIIPENLRPTSDQIERILEEYSEKEDTIEIGLDDDIDTSVCCQHIIDFWENHLLVPYRDEPNYTELMEEAIQDALADNCKSYIEGLRKSSKWDSGCRAIVEEFDKCMAGEDFDFTKSYEESKAITRN